MRGSYLSLRFRAKQWRWCCLDHSVAIGAMTGRMRAAIALAYDLDTSEKVHHGCVTFGEKGALHLATKSRIGTFRDGKLP